MLRLCEELDVRVLAYSPLAQGLLTGKYSEASLPRYVSQGSRPPRPALRMAVPNQPDMPLKNNV